MPSCISLSCTHAGALRQAAASWNHPLTESPRTPPQTPPLKVDEINGDINGVIDRDELLPAAALWKELQDSKKTMQYKFESTFCTLS